MLDYQNIVLGRELSREHLLGNQHKRTEWFVHAGVRLSNPLQRVRTALHQLAQQAAALRQRPLRERRT